MGMEALLRRMSFLPLRMAGVLAVLTVVGVTAGTVTLLVSSAFFLHPVAGMAVSVLLLYFSIAPRDLAAHAMAVCHALDGGDLALARQLVSMMVGRDTAELDAEGVTRAALESVAENSSDGVTAPLFYGMLFGPVGAWVYKAVNTLDSMFGYRNDRYLEFGWASARLDDLFNYIPARLTVLAVALAAFILRLYSLDTLRSVRVGARLHESPNAGYPESAFAGALGVKLGGLRSYGGVIRSVPELGLQDDEMSTVMLRRSVRLMYATALVFLAVGSATLFVLQRVISF
jgi:adenosylcobinamide-phosphate synthase